jgi:hypothetical protein
VGLESMKAKPGRQGVPREGSTSLVLCFVPVDCFLAGGSFPKVSCPVTLLQLLYIATVAGNSLRVGRCPGS